MRWLAAILMVVSGCAASPPEYPDAETWAFYAAELRGAGRLRADRAPRDATYTNDDLLETFRQIMLYDEYALVDGRFVDRRVPRLLEKFEGPVTVSLQGNAIRPTDRRQMGAMLERLRRVTGLQITQADNLDGATVIVTILDPVGRRSLAASLPSDPAWQSVAEELRGDLGGAVCVAYSLQDGEGPGSLRYLIVIPDEVRGLMRQSCIEEEVAQAFGPSADWSGARPSIFNDDEEFALFTEHDGWLLQILYDPRLRNGMTQDQAMPIARRILSELRPDDGQGIDRPRNRKRESRAALD